MMYRRGPSLLFRSFALFSVVVLFAGAWYWLYQRQRTLDSRLHSVRVAQLQQERFGLAVLARAQQADVEIRDTSSPVKQTWVDVQRQLRDAVVKIYTSIVHLNLIEPYKTPEQGGAMGSGFFIDSEGSLLTNYHVVQEAAAVHIQIPSLGKHQFECEVISASPERDIALVKVKDSELVRLKEKIGTIPCVRFGNSDQVVRGQKVLALGYPLDGQSLKSTQGIVSGRERMPDLPFAFIQTTAPINPGNSGGPAINSAGEVIGINAARHAWVGAQNVGYIIPINEIASALADLRTMTGVLRKPTLGCFFHVATDDMVRMLGNPMPGGWYVTRVFKGSLFERVGVCEGDMLYEVSGLPVDIYGEVSVPWSEDRVSVLELLNRFAVGDDIDMVLYRKGARKDIHFKLEHTTIPAVRMIYPEFEEIDYEVLGGMVISELTLNHVAMMIKESPHLIKFAEHEHQFEPSLIITHVLPNSQAQKASIFDGSIIVEANGKPVKTLTQFRDAVMQSPKSGFITLKTTNRMVDRAFAALPLREVLDEEQMLSLRYYYPISKLTRRLVKAVESQHQQFAAEDGYVQKTAA